MDTPIDNGLNEARNITFAGFSGTDACGDTNVAMTNDMAGRGRGWDHSAPNGNYGFAICTPVMLADLRFVGGVPTSARWKFSR